METGIIFLSFDVSTCVNNKLVRIFNLFHINFGKPQDRRNLVPIK